MENSIVMNVEGRNDRKCTCEVSIGEKGPKVIGGIILYERTLQLQ
jgi:hypothetical protein